MIRILEKKLILILMSLSVLLISSCSDSFDKGQKVWINIPGSSFADESFAIGKYIKRSKTKIVINPLKVVSASKRKEVVSLKLRVTSVPATWVVEFKEGKARYTALREATRKISALNLAKAIDPDKDITRLLKIAKQYELEELLAVVRLNKLKYKYLASALSTKEKIDNIPNILRSIKQLGQQSETYQVLLSAKPVVMTYLANKKPKNVILSRVTIKTKGVKATKLKYRMFLREAHKLVRVVENVLAASSSGGMEALQVISHMSGIMSAEEAYVEFVSDNGKRLRKVKIESILKFRRQKKAKKLANSLKLELKEKHEFYSITSMDEAQERYEAIIDEAKDIEKAYGIRIYSKADKQAFFMRPAKIRLKNLAKDEENSYLIATDFTLEGYHQIEMINAYLENYPKGKFRNEVSEMLSQAKEKESKEQSQDDVKRKEISERLANKKALIGNANYQNKVYNFKLQINQYNETNGDFSGRIVWTSRSGAISNIKGTFDQDDLVLRFIETKVIRKGKWPGFSGFEFNVKKKKKLFGVHSYKVIFIPETRPASLTL